MTMYSTRCNQQQHPHVQHVQTTFLNTTLTDFTSIILWVLYSSYFTSM